MLQVKTYLNKFEEKKTNDEMESKALTKVPLNGCEFNISSSLNYREIIFLKFMWEFKAGSNELFASR